jgi:simple sugar transport system ATP-binding protein
VDVASKELLLRSLADVAAQSGAGVLLCTDELSDLVICDRVVVFVRGEVFTEFSRPPFDRDELILATEGLDTSGPNAAGPSAMSTALAAAYNPAEEAAQ